MSSKENKNCIKCQVYSTCKYNRVHINHKECTLVYMIPNNKQQASSYMANYYFL